LAGTSIDGAGVLPFSVSVVSGVSGSLLDNMEGPACHIA